LVCIALFSGAVVDFFVLLPDLFWELGRLDFRSWGQLCCICPICPHLLLDLVFYSHVGERECVFKRDKEDIPVVITETVCNPLSFPFLGRERGMHYIIQTTLQILS
jgi:hypothetical protein